MRIAVAFASIAVLLVTSAISAESGVRVQYLRPWTSPPFPHSQPPPVLTMPFPACDRLPHPPRYPAIALARGEQGTVTLRIFVAATGKISEAMVFLSSGSARLDDAAVASTRSWMLEPGRQGTRPTAMWSEATVSFRILSGAADSTKVEIRFPMSASTERCLA